MRHNCPHPRADIISTEPGLENPSWEICCTSDFPSSFPLSFKALCRVAQDLNLDRLFKAIVGQLRMVSTKWYPLTDATLRATGPTHTGHIAFPLCGGWKNALNGLGGRLHI